MNRKGGIPMKQSKTTGSVGRGLLLGWCVGMGITFGLLTLWSVLLQGGRLSLDWSSLLSKSSFGLGCFLGSYLAAKRTVSGKLLWAFCAGALLLLTVLVIGLAIGEEDRVSPLGLSLVMILTVLASGLLAARQPKLRY